MTRADQDASVADASVAAIDAAAAIEAGSPLPWQEAIRQEKWSEAARAIDALPAAMKNSAEVRFAHARVLMALGKPADAIAKLEKLEDDLPLLRDLVLRARAEAQLAAGQRDKAAEYWATAGTTTTAWMRAAHAFEDGGDFNRARSLADRVVSAEKKPRAVDEDAHALRMRVVRDKDGAASAMADARWLAVNALDASNHRAAIELLEALTPPRALDGTDWIGRSRVLADAMRTDDALHALDRASAAAAPPSVIDQCRARAEAFWKARTRYSEAAMQYRACSQMGGAHQAEDAFLSARAFSRADRDVDALMAFNAVVQHHPHTTWADQAEFHMARTHALAGHWRDAAHAFDEYAQHFPNGHERREADRYRALSHLLAADRKIARKLLEDLAGGAEDPDARARFSNLAALAALEDGERTYAIARWTEVARSRPLSWAALVARARLVSLSAPIPLTIDPAESGDVPGPIAIELPSPSDLLHRIGLDREAEDALRERESQIVGKAGGRGTEALCGAYATLDRGKRRYQVSLGIAASLLATAPGPKNRWAWECSFPEPHRAFVDAAQGVSPELVWAVMRQESAFDPEVVSPARAVGLLQLLPETARTVATQANIPFEDDALTRPAANIALGARYLRELLDKMDGNVPLAVASYNAGPEAIQRWQSHTKGTSLDVFVELIPFVETRGYVVRVMTNLARYGFLDRGEAGVPRVSL
ncbi:MAG TPA: lytic transglycosylase domain-containing protein [Labilithrix sp.]